MFEDTEINLAVVKSLLNNYFKTPSNQKISIDKIQKTVAEFYDLKISDLLSKNRSKNIANARQIAMYLCKKLTQENLKNIGDKFNKNHATVIHSFKLISELENKCPKTTQEIKIIEEKLL